MAQEITTKLTLDADDYLKDWDRISDRIGQYGEQTAKLGKQNPFAELASKQILFNQQLGQQVQTWQRVEAATVSYRKEQERVKQTTADIKKRQDELAAANTYADLKKQIGQVETALQKGLNEPLKQADSWWDKIKAKFAKGLSIPKIDIPGSNSLKKGSSSGSSLANMGTEILDEVAGQAGVNLSGGTLAAGAAVAATAATVIKGTKEWAEYGEKLAEVSALTGATGKSLNYLDDQAQKIEKSTGIAGKEVLEAFKNIAGIKPELLENNQALTETTRVVIELAQASKGAWTIRPKRDWVAYPNLRRELIRLRAFPTYSQRVLNWAIVRLMIPAKR